MGALPTVMVLTPRGRGAVAVVRVRADAELLDAPPALFRAANGRPLAEQRIDRVCFGRWGSDPAEEVVVCRVAQDVTEVTCHGGTAAVARIVRDLEQRGCRAAPWDEEQRDGQSRLTAECQAALTQAPTFRTAAILLEQASGVLEGDLTALLEAAPEEWVSRLDGLLGWSNFGRHLTQPWQVVLTGMPNVGKSSLINRLLGYTRSIVYDQPGTTRDVVTAITVFDGWPMELSDTAGLRDAEGEIEAAGVDRARRQLEQADLPVIVLDRSRPLRSEERTLMADLPGALLVAHKADLPGCWQDEGPPAAIDVSSVTGQGIDELIAAIVARLVPRAPDAGTAVPVTQRQIASLTAARNAVAAGDAAAAREQIVRCLCRGN